VFNCRSQRLTFQLLIAPNDDQLERQALKRQLLN
jgi:hypothetical protein